MALRKEALTDVFQSIYDREPAITSADVLLEFARRNQIARHHRVTRKDAVEFLRPEGRYQVYKRVPVEWPGRISKPGRILRKCDSCIVVLDASPCGCVGCDGLCLCGAV